MPIATGLLLESDAQPSAVHRCTGESDHSGRVVGHTEVIAKNGALNHWQLRSGCGHALQPQSPSAFLTAIRRSPSQEPLESSTIVELVAIVTRLICSVPLYVLTCLGRYRTDLPSSAGRPLSATHFLGHAL